MGPTALLLPEGSRATDFIAIKESFTLGRVWTPMSYGKHGNHCKTEKDYIDYKDYSFARLVRPREHIEMSLHQPIKIRWENTVYAEINEPVYKCFVPEMSGCAHTVYN
jgi:hypothetical protein